MLALATTPLQTFTTSGFNVFDATPTNTFASFAGAYLIATVVAHVCAAGCLYLEASRLRRDHGRGPVLFPPFLWALLALTGGMTSLLAVTVLFIALHYTSWCTAPPKDLDGMADPSLRDAHEEKVRQLRAELAELRQKNRDA
ncbi:MAG: hypothetical protein ACJAZN_000031 [Planctomycetota bacterium]|jgi:hypothetical protein